MKSSYPFWFYIIGLLLISIGYVWLWTFKTNPHILIKFLTMQAYFLSWLYYLCRTLRKQAILRYPLISLFEMNIVLQTMVTGGYWLFIHGWMLKYLNLPDYEISWNIYIHSVPLILLLIQFAITRIKIGRNWKHTLIFLLIFAFPVNYYYTMWHGPVYYFLTYQTRIDILIILVALFVAFLIHISVSLVFGKLAIKEQKIE